MSDDKPSVGEPDRSRISMSEDYEVEYWTRELGVTREELERAVDQVGSSGFHWRARDASTQHNLMARSTPQA